MNKFLCYLFCGIIMLLCYSACNVNTPKASKIHKEHSDTAKSSIKKSFQHGADKANKYWDNQ
jgi:hypothetical protein